MTTTSDLETAIIEAVVEARVLESARAEFDVDNMLTVAARLSKASIEEVEAVYFTQWVKPCQFKLAEDPFKVEALMLDRPAPEFV